MPRFQSFDGIELDFLDEGDGSPVVLLHGFASNSDFEWRRSGLWEALVGAGHRAIGLDARGHGRSASPHDPAVYANDPMSRDVTALFDHLGLTEVDVVGYSMGAAVALKVALSDSRVHRLVVGGSDGHLVAHPPSAAALERRKHIASALLTKDAATIGDSNVRRLRAFAESTGSDLEALAAIQLAPHRYGQPADLSALCVPALVVCGNEDVSPESLASHLPHATAIIVPGTHETALHSHDFVATVVDFLA